MFCKLKKKVSEYLGEKKAKPVVLSRYVCKFTTKSGATGQCDLEWIYSDALHFNIHNTTVKKHLSKRIVDAGIIEDTASGRIYPLISVDFFEFHIVDTKSVFDNGFAYRGSIYYSNDEVNAMEVYDPEKENEL